MPVRRGRLPVSTDGEVVNFHASLFHFLLGLTFHILDDGVYMFSAQMCHFFDFHDTYSARLSKFTKY